MGGGGAWGAKDAESEIREMIRKARAKLEGVQGTMGENASNLKVLKDEFKQLKRTTTTMALARLIREGVEEPGVRRMRSPRSGSSLCRRTRSSTRSRSSSAACRPNEPV